jgi:hypothetical protein
MPWQRSSSVEDGADLRVGKPERTIGPGHGEAGDSTLPTTVRRWMRAALTTRFASLSAVASAPRVSRSSKMDICHSAVLRHPSSLVSVSLKASICLQASQRAIEN